MYVRFKDLWAECWKDGYNCNIFWILLLSHNLLIEPICVASKGLTDYNLSIVSSQIAIFI